MSALLAGALVVALIVAGAALPGMVGIWIMERGSR